MKINIKTIMTALLCVYLATLILLCMMKTDSMPEVKFTLLGLPLDKVLHFCMFLPYPMLAFQVFVQKGSTCLHEILLLGIILIFGAGLAYGTERLQGLTDYRSYEMADFFADMIGLIAGAAAVLLQISLKKR